jgi:hypothetical protein
MSTAMWSSPSPSRRLPFPPAAAILCRRLRTRLGAPKAITAMGHRLARLVYRMLKYGQQYVDKGAENYERRYRNQQIQSLRKKAAQLGFQLMDPSTTAN